MTIAAAANVRSDAGAMRRVILVICGLVLLAFVGLIPLGMWYDEFFTIAHIRDDGISFELQRLLGWSPRPFSELLVYLYSRAVIVFDRPLVSVVLAPLWGVLALAIVLPPMLTGRGLEVCAVLGCLFLLGHNVGEVFYWPIGALAYVPTLASLALLFTLDAAGMADRPVGRVWSMVALLIAALSTEVGAVFSTAYCLLAMGVAVVTRDRKGMWLLVPLLVSGGVLDLVFHGRAAQNLETFGDPAIAHHPLAAVGSSVRSFLLQVVGTDAPSPSATNVVQGALSKAVFFLGAYWTLSSRPGDRTVRRQLLRCALAAALVGSAFVTLTAAYYQFGTECCQRHATLRQGSIFIAIAALALVAAAWRPRPDPARGAWLLILALALPMTISLPRLATDYRHYRRFVAVRTETWQSGANPSSEMVVPQTDVGKIVGGTLVAPGTYTATGPGQDVYAQRLVDFFRKQSGRFLPP